MTRVNDAGSALQTTRRKDRGIVIILVALTVFVIVALAGLAIDLCRIYITQNELQNFTDSGAIWAVSKLDGSVPGIAAARVVALPVTDSGTNENRWAFGMEQIVSGVTTVEFATDAAGPFVANPPTPAGYRFARVSTQSTIPVYFASIFPGVGFNSIVGAFSIAGQAFQTGLGDGLFPFSPDAHNCSDPNYGFMYGGLYTLRWGNPTPSNPGEYTSHPLVLTSIDGVDLATCPGSVDALHKPYGFQPGETSQSQRGYINLANLGVISGGGGAALIRNTIFGQASFQGTLNIGDSIDPAGGAKSTITTAMRDLVALDGDPTTDYYYTDGAGPYAQTYLAGAAGWPLGPGPITVGPLSNVAPSLAVMNGNPLYRPDWPAAYHLEGPGGPPPPGTGHRMVVVPINCGTNNGLIVGFAGFLLPPEPCPDFSLDLVNPNRGKVTPCCAYYLGPTQFGAGSPGLGSGAGAFRVMLFR